MDDLNNSRINKIQSQLQNHAISSKADFVINQNKDNGLPMVHEPILFSLSKQSQKSKGKKDKESIKEQGQKDSNDASLEKLSIPPQFDNLKSSQIIISNDSQANLGNTHINENLKRKRVSKQNKNPFESDEEPENLVYVWIIDGSKFTMHKNEATDYIKNLLKYSGILLTEEDKIRDIYKKDSFLGLFKVFFTDEIIKALREHVNKTLQEKKKLSNLGFDAYIGLELAMGVIKFAQLKDYWRRQLFSGHDDFTQTMSRDNFAKIRTLLSPKKGKFSAPSSESNDDQLSFLRHSYALMIKQCSSTCTPYGISFFHERTTKGRSKTDVKRIMFPMFVRKGLIFDCIQNMDSGYYCSLYDKTSNLKVQFLRIYEFLKRNSHIKSTFFNFFPLLNTFFNDEDSIDIKAIESEIKIANWALQISEQAIKNISGTKKQIIIMEHGCVSHRLAMCISGLTDNKLKVMGTVEFKSVEDENRSGLLEAFKILKESKFGEWVLVAAYNKIQGSDMTDDLNLSSTLTKEIAHFSGYIVFKNKFTILYTNDLACTPVTEHMVGTDPYAIHCVRGVLPTTHISMEKPHKRTRINLPVCFIAFNIIIEEFNSNEDHGSLSILKRHGSRELVPVFVHMLDIASQNAYALYSNINDGNPSVDFREFKRTIAEMLVKPFLLNRGKIKRPLDYSTSYELIKREGSQSHPPPYLDRPTKAHLLLTNKNNAQIPCHLCLILRNKEFMTVYGCASCYKGFHVDCFSAFHFPDSIQSNIPVILQMSGISKILARRDIRTLTSEHVNSCRSFTLPSFKTHEELQKEIAQSEKSTTELEQSSQHQNLEYESNFNISPLLPNNLFTSQEVDLLDDLNPNSNSNSESSRSSDLQ